MATLNKWVSLDGPISRRLTQELPSFAHLDLRKMMKEAGLQYRSAPDCIRFRANPGADKFVYAKQLQVPDGSMRQDARHTVLHDALEEGIDLEGLLSSPPCGAQLEVSAASILQIQLYKTEDPMPTLRSIAAQGDRLYRVGVRPLLYTRLHMLALIDELAGPTPIREITKSARRLRNTIASGIGPATPASLACFSMLAL